jgi:pimeloyl-ACP methyl ester carboxylesterase
MASGEDAVRREDFAVPGEGGITLFVRAVAPGEAASRPGVPVLLIHGARVPGLASFDLPVPGGSLAADLAAAGHPSYIMDVRGYGGSTRPAAMEEPPASNPPLVRTAEAARDIAAVAGWIAARHGGRPAAALGWATGGQWLGYCATLHPALLSHAILFNSLYGGHPEHPSLGWGSSLEDPERPGQFHRAGTGAYRHNTAASLLPGWDSSIPDDDKDAWRDPAVATAYQAAALASDATAGTRMPPSFRAPSGALEDSFYLATGRQLWDASLLRTPTLCIRSERDFWSRPEDSQLLAEHAIDAPVRVVTLPGATHFAHLDRPARGRDAFLRAVLEFLADSRGEG